VPLRVVQRGGDQVADEVTAQATIEERQLLKSLNWWDGFEIGRAHV